MFTLLIINLCFVQQIKISEAISATNHAIQQGIQLMFVTVFHTSYFSYIALYRVLESKIMPSPFSGQMFEEDN